MPTTSSGEPDRPAEPSRAPGPAQPPHPPGPTGPQTAAPLPRLSPRRAAAFVAACLVLFVVLAFVVQGENAITRFDADTVADIAGGRSAGLVDVARAITLLGNGAIVAVLLLIVAAALGLSRRLAPPASLVPLLSLAIGTALTPLLKTIVDRPRPPVALHEVTERTSGFPSGHSAQSAAGWLALGLVLWASGRGWRPLVATIALVLAVGLSRIVLGVHSPTDVLSGWAVGLACAVTVVAIGLRRGWVGDGR